MTKENKNKNSALKVNKGVEQPSTINPNFKNVFANKFKKERLTIDEYFNGIINNNRTVVSKAITLIESTLPKDKEIARKLIKRCLPHSDNSFRLGITGVPGAGKSTFIEALGLFLIKKKKKVAVLAIDPASKRSKGSILGDKTRMENLSTNENAFIRPTSSAGTLGGVSRNTRESIILLEAAGFDFIIVETVGVGQSETAVAQMTDFFLLMLIAGGGDELQGIKRGIMEMADLLVINKADGDNIKKAQKAKQEYKNALHLFPPTENGWIPTVITASALFNTGIEKTWKLIKEFERTTKENGYFLKHRKQQLLDILYQTINETLFDMFYHNNIIKNNLEVFKSLILEGKTTPYDAAEKLLKDYYG
jgi:LAO/AO transport system kinase